MGELTVLARWGGFIFLISLAAIILYKMITGNICFDGLLTGDRKDGASYFSLGRTQLLIFTLIIAARYVKDVFAHPSTTSLPEISTQSLELLGGSQLFYVAGKARALLFGPSAPNSDKGNDQ
jgi:hypothetical protein